MLRARTRRVELQFGEIFFGEPIILIRYCCDFFHSGFIIVVICFVTCYQFHLRGWRFLSGQHVTISNDVCEQSMSCWALLPRWHFHHSLRRSSHISLSSRSVFVFDPAVLTSCERTCQFLTFASSPHFDANNLYSAVSDVTVLFCQIHSVFRVLQPSLFRCHQLNSSPITILFPVQANTVLLAPVRPSRVQLAPTNRRAVSLRVCRAQLARFAWWAPSTLLVQKIPQHFSFWM